MTCDIKLSDKPLTYCSNEVEYYGRWIGYCEEHKAEGKQQDWDKTYSNEIDGRDDLNGLDGEVTDMMVENL